MSAALVLAVLLAAAPPPDEAVRFGRLGEVHLVHPAGEPKDVALLLEGDGGHEPRMQQLARALADAGALVIAVDTKHYLAGFSAGGRCAYPAGDLEAVSQWVQKRLALREYLHPALVGYSSGASLAWAALAQAPRGTFRGVVALGFCPDLPMQGALCAGSGLARRHDARHRAEVFSPSAQPGAPFTALVGDKDRTCSVAKARAFSGGVEGARVVALPAQGHDFRDAGVWLPAVLDAYRALPLAEARAHPTRPVPSAPPAPSAPEPVDDLPLVEVPATGGAQGDAFALLVTGDGGWAGIDQELARALAAEGMPVVGLNSLRYFWKAKTPEEAAQDVARVVRHYLTAWGKRRVVLMGYSRGADVVPAIAARLPEDVRGHVRALVLVSAGRAAEFEVKVADFLTRSGAGAPILPELQRLGATPVLCLYGDEERDETVCTQLGGLPQASAVELQGGHHFGGDYAGVARRVVAFVR